MIPLGGPARSSLARRRIALWGANSARRLPVRHYRVSHLGAETPQDYLEVGRRDWRRSGGHPRGLDVVLVVRAGDGAIVSAPAPAVLGVPLPLAGRGRAGPLARPQPGVGMEQRLAEWKERDAMDSLAMSTDDLMKTDQIESVASMSVCAHIGLDC